MHVRISLMLRMYDFSNGVPGNRRINNEWSVHWGTYLSSQYNYIYAYIDGTVSHSNGYRSAPNIYNKIDQIEIHQQISILQ